MSDAKSTSQPFSASMASDLVSLPSLDIGWLNCEARTAQQSPAPAWRSGSGPGGNGGDESDGDDEESDEDAQRDLGPPRDSSLPSSFSFASPSC